jgi:hypothetical protein
MRKPIRNRRDWTQLCSAIKCRRQRCTEYQRAYTSQPLALGKEVMGLCSVLEIVEYSSTPEAMQWAEHGALPITKHTTSSSGRGSITGVLTNFRTRGTLDAGGYGWSLDWLQEHGDCCRAWSAPTCYRPSTVREARYMTMVEDIPKEQGRGQRCGNQHHTQASRDGEGGDGVGYPTVLDIVYRQSKCAEAFVQVHSWVALAIPAAFP